MQHPPRAASTGRRLGEQIGEPIITEIPAPGHVHYERHGRILKITIDHRAKRNAIQPQMLAQLAAALTLLEHDDDLWVGVVCGAGDHFTAGLDMPKFFGADAEPDPTPRDSMDPLGLRNQSSKPIITAVQGICFTYGIELMLAGDIVVAAEDCRFSQLEVRRGIAPLGGAHFRFLDRAGWGNGLYHLLLGDEFSAAEAYRIGLVQEVVPTGRQLDRAMELAGAIAANAPLAVRAIKLGARRYIDDQERAAVAALDEMSSRVLGSADAAEGVLSFIERRAAAFRGV